eukprot:scaffold666_cov49-Prasinocladus_malaysianus.AAC.2
MEALGMVRHCLKALAENAKKGKPSAKFMTAACAELEKVMKFVAEDLTGGDEAMCSRLGSNLWPRITKGLIARQLSSLEPKEACNLSEFELALGTAKKLEALAAELHLCERAETGPLHEYGASAIRKFLERRVGVLLSEARDLVVAPLGDSVVEAGEDLGCGLAEQQEGQEVCLLRKGKHKVGSCCSIIFHSKSSLIHISADVEQNFTVLRHLDMQAKPPPYSFIDYSFFSFVMNTDRDTKLQAYLTISPLSKPSDDAEI